MPLSASSKTTGKDSRRGKTPGIPCKVHSSGCNFSILRFRPSKYAIKGGLARSRGRNKNKKKHGYRHGRGSRMAVVHPHPSLSTCLPCCRLPSAFFFSSFLLCFVFQETLPILWALDERGTIPLDDTQRYSKTPSVSTESVMALNRWLLPPDQLFLESRQRSGFLTNSWLDQT